MKNAIKFITMLAIVLMGQVFAKDFGVEYSKSRSAHQLEFSVDDYSVETETINGTDYSVLYFDGGAKLNQKGFAELPYIHASVQIDARRDYSVRVVSSEYVDISLDSPMIPSRGVLYRNQNISKIPYVIDPKSVTDKWYPEALAVVSEPYVLRDVRGINVYVRPFQYNAKQNTLRVYSKIAVELVPSRTSTNPLKREDVTNNVMNSVYDSMFVNYNATGNLNLADMGDMLVIYTARDKAAIAPYVEWKKAKGFNVKELMVATGTNVKSVIKSEYDTNKKLLYVQLVGDWEDIKSDLGPSSAPMDPMLGCVEGTDYYADVIIGRFSAKTPADVSIQVAKVIKYERDADAGATWYKKAIGIGSSDGAQPSGAGKGDDSESDWFHNDRIAEFRLLKTTYDTYYPDHDKLSTPASKVAEQLNSGVGFMNYTGHGSHAAWSSTGFSNNSIASLNNKEMLPFIVSVACVNGEFHTGTDSFAEAWLKKENGGAIAMWASTINQPWSPPMRGQDYFSDLLIGGFSYNGYPGQGVSTLEGRTTFGSLTFNAAHLMYSEASQGEDLDTIKTWTIFGDASLQVRTDAPKEINLSNTNVLMGVPYQVTVTQNGAPVEGAIVALSQNGNVYKAATNESGVAVIEHELEVAEVSLTVTGFNLTTYSKNTMVIPPNGSFVVVADYTKSVEHGSIADLDFAMKNVGNVTAANIVATISTDSSYVKNILDNKVELQSISAGATKNIEQAFKVAFENQIPDKAVIPFSVRMESVDGRKVSEGKMFVKVQAPVLKSEMSFSPAGQLNPGDEKEFTYTITNTGSAIAANVMADLDYAGDLAIDISGAGFVGNIAPGTSKQVTFKVAFDAVIPTGSGAALQLTLKASKDYQVKASNLVTIGMTDTFESGVIDAKWTQAGNANWGVVSPGQTGSFAAKAGTITHSQSTSIALKANFSSAGKITFWKKVSSEKSYDYLKLYVDGVEVAKWSGEVDWSAEQFDVTAGTHEIKWVYMKDYMANAGQDTAWLDQILLIGGTVL